MEQNSKVIMWAAQTQIVWRTVQQDGVSYVKKEYIDKKYGETAWIFRTAYDFFIRRFQMKVDKPEEAKSPVWLYLDPKWASAGPGTVLMKLEVPENQIVYFDMRRWSEVLNLSFVGEGKEEFEKELQRQGVRDSMEVFSKPFYPLLKNKIQRSWDRIFEIENVEPQYIQGAVWCIKKEWIKDVTVL